VRLGRLWYQEISSLMPSPYVRTHLFNRHAQTVDKALDSTVSPGLVPRDEVQGSRQGSTRKVSNLHRWSHGIREGCHEGQFVMCPGIRSCLRPRCNHQSGEGFSHSITSDCLSRLEGDEQPSFSERVIGEVSGALFGGALLSRPRTHPCS